MRNALFLLSACQLSVGGALWTTLGRDIYRTSSATGVLPGRIGQSSVRVGARLKLEARDVALRRFRFHLPPPPPPPQVIVNVLQANVSFSRFSPLIGQTLVTVASSNACNLTFFDHSFSLIPIFDGTWTNCLFSDISTTTASDPIIVNPSMTASGSLLVVATAALGSVVFDASPSLARQPLYTAQLPFIPTGGALVQNCTATWVSSDGLVALQLLPEGPCKGIRTLEASPSWFRFTRNTAPRPRSLQPPPPPQLVSQAVLCPPNTYVDDIPDGISKAPTALPNGGGFLIVSRYGCLTGFSSDGQVLWNASLSLSFNGSLVASDTVVSSADAQAYLLSHSGLLCCVALGGKGPGFPMAGSACAGWRKLRTGPDPDLSSLSTCTDLTLAGAVLPIRSGLALSPDTNDFHGGQIYATDAVGALLVVRTGTGVSGGSSQSGVFKAGSAMFAAPALVNAAWGETKNGLILVSAGGHNRSHAGACAAINPSGGGQGRVPACVIALEVGSNGDRDDDDARDDDYAATIGRMWAVSLGETCVANASGFAIADDGRIFVPTSQGLFVISGRPTSPSAGPNEALFEGVAFSSVAVGIFALSASLGCVARQRRLKKARLVREARDDAQDGVDNEDAAAYGLLGSVNELAEAECGGGNGYTPQQGHRSVVINRGEPNNQRGNEDTRVVRRALLSALN